MIDTRGLARDVLVAVDGGARTNVALAAALERAGAGTGGLDGRDTALVTELVYGTVRMQRACDWLAAPFVSRALEPPVRAAVRIGVHQLAHMRTPAHAAVSTAVDAAPKRARGLVNAVLRRVAGRLERDGPRWPDEPTRLSYPDWIAQRLVADLGDAHAWAAMAAMNEPQQPVVRPDGYRQGRASIRVAEQLTTVDVDGPVVDLCAAPGGKATALPGPVVACDIDADRVATLVDTIEATGRADVVPVIADGRRPPVRRASAAAVLVDAPCSNLGALGRRPDARWRAAPADVDRLADLQRAILAAAVPILAPGGLLVYAVCTLTVAETVAVDGWLGSAHPELEPQRPVGTGWRRWGRSGGLILPQDAGTDGMAVFRYRVLTSSDGSTGRRRAPAR